MFKKIIAVSLFLIPSVSLAWEQPKNPDRFPSLALTLDGTSSTGDYSSSNLRQDVENQTSELLFDTRLPLSEYFTLSIGLGAIGTTFKGKENSNFFSSETKTNGGHFFISGRFYFNH